MPVDDPSIDEEEYLAEVAKRCRSKYAPCGGCQQGGICDNYDHIEEREDERESDREPDDFDDE